MLGKKFTLVLSVLAHINTASSLMGQGMFIRDGSGARSNDALRELCDASKTVSCRLIFATSMFVQANARVSLEDVANEFRPYNFTVGPNFLIDPFEGVLHTMRTIRKAPLARFSVARVHVDRVLNAIESPVAAVNSVANSVANSDVNSVVQVAAPYNLAFMNEDERRRSSADGVRAADRCDVPIDTYVHDTRLGKGTTVFIIGDSVNIEHDDFSGTMRRAYAGSDPSRTCSAWHGTHVAGVVGGRIHGIAKGASIVSVPVAPGCRETFRADEYARGLQWVIDTRRSYLQSGDYWDAPAVVLTVPRQSMKRSQTVAIQVMEDLLNQLIALNVTVVAPAGDSGVDACSFSPPRLASVITVAALEITREAGQGVEAGTTMAHPWFESNQGTCVDLWAPGSYIESAFSPGPDEVAVYSGTAQAAAMTAGVAALILERSPRLTPSQVKSAMLSDWTSKNLLLYRNESTSNLVLQTYGCRYEDIS